MDVEHEIDEIYNGLKDQPPHTPEQVKAVRDVIKLTIVTFLHRRYDETRQLVSPTYKQHNYEAGDGPESIVEFSEFFYDRIKTMGKKPELRTRFQRILVDGEYVVVHSHLIRWSGDRGMNIMDIYKYRDGQFQEHWDLLNEVPQHSKNSNGVF